MMGGFDHNGYGMGHGFGWIFMILFWGIVIFAIVAITKHFSKGNLNGSNNSKAQEILKERYARGEISKEEYDSMRKDLEN